MINLLHNLKHFLGWSPGKMIILSIDGIYYHGAQCQKCGSINHITKSKYQENAQTNVNKLATLYTFTERCKQK